MSDLHLTKDGCPIWETNTMDHFNQSIDIIRGIDDHIARYYYIDGLRGERKKNSLDRDLITLEQEIWQLGR